MAELMSLRAYAKRRGVTPMAVSFAVRDGRLVESVARDKFGQPKISDPDLADREWDANTSAEHRIRAAGNVDVRAPLATSAPTVATDEAGEPLNVASAAARSKHWEAKLRELKFKEAAGELTPSAEVARVIADEATRAKTRLLAIPSRARQAMPHLTTPDLATLEALIREALEELASGDGE